MRTKKELNSYLQSDLSRFNNKKPTIFDWMVKNECWYVYYLIKHIRYIEYYQEKKGLHKIPFYIHWFIYKRLSFKLHITIYPGTIGSGLRIYHIGSFIHVGKNCRIGKNCTLQPGVVFGNKHEQDSIGETVVGDNCYFGLDAKIFGPLVIGNNVTIGANTIVTKDVPNNAIVGGVNKILGFKE